MNQDEKYKIVDFEWCNLCKYVKRKEEEEPCCDCLNEPVNLYTTRPVEFVSAAKEGQDG